MKSLTALITALGLASAGWLCLVHCCFTESPEFHRAANGVPPKAKMLLAHQIDAWQSPEAEGPAEITRMRRTNAEWDFMGRSFLVWSLAEIGLRDPAARPGGVRLMDGLIHDTLAAERRHGFRHFLMPYASARSYVVQPEGSLFVDGEIALMLAARRTLSDDDALRTAYRERAERIVRRLETNPCLAGESYPDECWLFDHTIALAALRCGDRIDGTDHGDLCARWSRNARQRLIDPRTGLLVSSYTVDGRPLDGPEGSTIWGAVHFLRLIDPELAQEQYQRARQELARSLLGFAWSREWPTSWRGPTDVDSGAVIPGLDVSAGGSGLAFVAAASFGDEEFLRQLHATLNLAAFPSRQHGRLHYCASNLVGDAVILYSCVLGPWWDRS